MSIDNQTAEKLVEESAWNDESDQEYQQRADIFMPGAPPAAPPPPEHPQVQLQAGATVDPSQAMAEFLTTSFAEMLKAATIQNGGYLTVQRIDELKAEFIKNAGVFKTAFEQFFEVRAEARERSAMNLSRDYPFDRLIVSKFAHLFSNDNELLSGDDTISRRILPGFFMAMNMMLSPEFAEEHQEKTRQLVKRMSQGREDEFDWEEVYGSEEANELILDALVAMAYYFEDKKKRSDWFISMMNDHMRPFAADADPDLRTWSFTEGAFNKFIKELFSDLKETISSEAGRLKISKKYSVDTCVVLAEILKQFD